MTLGVVIALVGHMAKSYRVVAVGLAILFIATALMVVVGSPPTTTIRATRARRRIARSPSDG